MAPKCSLNPLDDTVCFADPKNTVPCSPLCGPDDEAKRSAVELVQIQTKKKS